MKELCYIIPKGSCPTCGHKQFIVYHRTEILSLTDMEGQIIDSQNISDYAIGKCINCGKEYDMIILNETYIPATPLRKLLYEYDPHTFYDENIIESNIPNPMEMNKNEG